MKARKKVVGIFLVIVVLCLGVGFAALTDLLQINGTVDIDTSDVSDVFDGNIFFSTPDMKASTADGETGITATLNTPVLSDQNDTMTITIDAGTFKAVGQAVIATAKIENSSLTNDANIAITATQVNTDGEVSGSPSGPLTVGSFEVTTTLSSTTIAKNDGTANGTIDVTIKIKLVKLPTENESNTFTFKLTATAVAD